MKLFKFFLTAVVINLFLFIVVYLMPINPLRFIISYLTSFFVFIFGLGLKVSVTLSRDLCTLVTTHVNLKLYQTFYEFLTIIALTIPLYLNSWRRLFEKVIVIIVIMISYYVFLYGITILFLQNGFNVPWLLAFIKFNTESFMIFAFGIIWFFVNKNEIMEIIEPIRKY